MEQVLYEFAFQTQPPLFLQQLGKKVISSLKNAG
jgi:hypothetical protein